MKGLLRKEEARAPIVFMQITAWTALGDRIDRRARVVGLHARVAR